MGNVKPKNMKPEVAKSIMTIDLESKHITKFWNSRKRKEEAEALNKSCPKLQR
jgi:hypothetical protein